MTENRLLFRFNVVHGLAQIGLEEHKETGAIADATQTYLDDPKVGDEMSLCARQLSGVGVPRA